MLYVRIYGLHSIERSVEGKLCRGMLYKYDLAVSFARSQREIAERFSRRLDASGYSIFYDAFYQSHLWGQDLAIALEDVYMKEARYCLILLSAEYLERSWTNHERRSAISRFIAARNDYILCLKVDDVQLPGLASTIGYISLDDYSEDDIYKLLLQKLGRPDHEDQLVSLRSEDISHALRIIEICFRRAIYTRMDSEIMLDAMYRSINDAIGDLQIVAPQISDQYLQLLCIKIIASLDSIERFRNTSGAGISNHMSLDDRKIIDEHKLQVVRHLLEIRRASQIPMQLPFTLGVDHFFGYDEAGGRPNQFNL